jgi:serine/threonine-protein kinase
VSTDTFGKYRLVAELGSGGMADVSLAIIEGPTGLGFSKLLVIKRLRPNLTEDPEFVAMLVDEARLAARLNHPNVVQTVEVGDVDGRYYIAMEHLEGQALQRIQQRGARGKPVPQPVQYRVLADVLGGLHHAHELTDYDGTPLEVVHRDVSPHNIFVTYDGVAKIVDFGIAKAEGRGVETRTGVVKGKLTYMAPEQAMAFGTDRRADIFSAGIILWEIATGQRMWKGLQDTDILRRLIGGNIPTSPRAVNADVPERLDRICQRALAVHPEERYSTALEFQQDLETYLEDSAQGLTTRDVARTISEMFGEERQRMRQRIEAKLSDLASGAPSSSLPVLTEPLSSSNPNLAMVHSRKAPSNSLPASAAARPPPSSVSVSARPRGKRRTRTSSSNLHWFALVVLGIGVAYAAFALQPQLTSGGVARLARLPAVTVPTWKTIRVTLRATPSDARFSIDDGPLLANPHTGEVAADGLQHRIRIEAPGHVERVRVVPFAEDVDVEVALQRREEPGDVRRAGAAAQHHRPRPALASPPSPPDARGVPAARRKREIDTSSPWD